MFRDFISLYAFQLTDLGTQTLRKFPCIQSLQNCCTSNKILTDIAFSINYLSSAAFFITRHIYKIKKITLIETSTVTSSRNVCKDLAVATD